ncbi:BRCT domain-containing protein [Devosia naphthalenivorans]|uniref:BRCT domain-containing protein n=1 Tax=Devosia naphthalenivorans TaxID=2082392 RepID=UPI000D38DDE5|nr:BRCT domain-containing protein [Devosia naphthalenivorans]
MNGEFYNTVGGDRIESRQVDELIGIARGLIADGQINQAEAEFLQKWLAANVEVSGQPLIRMLYRRINEILSDGVADEDEKVELFETLSRFSSGDFEIGEPLKASTLPICQPSPSLTFPGLRYTFTGTFNFGQRKHCEAAVIERGASAGGIAQKTNVLVIGVYATESWKHSSFGNKILQAVEWREQGFPISIVSEDHWVKHLD